VELEKITKVAVIGAGSMGSQIAEIISRLLKCSVTIQDINDELVNNGISNIGKRIQQFFVSKDKMTVEEMEVVIGRISGTTSISEAAKDADWVIEAASEILEVKREIFGELDKFAPPGAVMASNTSGVSITEIASATKRPDKVVGMHFFNPVAVMRLVEVVRGALTSKQTTDAACAFSSALGKEPVVCRDVGYGFLANRAYMALANEAMQIVWEGVASPEDVDKALKLGFNLPVGPLELGDRLGYKIRVQSEQDRIREVGEEKGRLHPLIRMMDRAGYKGGPGGKGIYEFWKDSLSKW